jgi:hypothetical protein
MDYLASLYRARTSLHHLRLSGAGHALTAYGDSRRPIAHPERKSARKYIKTALIAELWVSMRVRIDTQSAHGCIHTVVSH